MNNQGSTPITISPNPFQDHFTIHFAEPAEAGEYNLFDINGRLVQRGVLVAESISRELDASMLQSGAYLLQIIAGENVSNHRIIKN